MVELMTLVLDLQAWHFLYIHTIRWQYKSFIQVSRFQGGTKYSFIIKGRVKCRLKCIIICRIKSRIVCRNVGIIMGRINGRAQVSKYGFHTNHGRKYQLHNIHQQIVIHNWSSPYSTARTNHYHNGCMAPPVPSWTKAPCKYTHTRALHSRYNHKISHILHARLLSI